MFSEVRFQFIWACKDSLQFLPLKYYTRRLIHVLWKIVFWWLFEEHYKWEKKKELSTRSQDSASSPGLSPSAIF